jgi:hexosaminidase
MAEIAPPPPPLPPPPPPFTGSAAYAKRGVMLDISRDRIPTMQHLLEIVDTLAALRFNHLQLYTEHTFAYRGHEEVWRGSDPMTPAEYIELDTYCRGRGIELAANQNCFGHLASWLRHPRYAELAETQGEWIFEYNGESFPRSGPFSLCPTDPRSLELIGDLLGQLLPCFSSPLVNIGCDETFDVGAPPAARSAQAVQERGRTAVCIDFIGEICQIARAHGKRPMYWADIVLRQPQLAGQLGDAIALVWDYEPGYPWRERVTSLTSQGIEAWVCPGTSCWRSITGRTTERRLNLRESARQGLQAGATGFMVTAWGDTGHHQQWPITLHALAEAAHAAWTGGRDGHDSRAAALHTFGDAELGPWLNELGDLDLELRQISGKPAAGGSPRPLRNSSALFVDLHLPLKPGPEHETRAALLHTPCELWRQAADRLQELHRDGRWRIPGVQDELALTLEIAELALQRAVIRRSTGTPVFIADPLQRLEKIKSQFRALWLRRSRPGGGGGLESSMRHWDRIHRDLQGLCQ